MQERNPKVEMSLRLVVAVRVSVYMAQLGASL